MDFFLGIEWGREIVLFLLNVFRKTPLELQHMMLEPSVFIIVDESGGADIMMTGFPAVGEAHIVMGTCFWETAVGSGGVFVGIVARLKWIRPWWDWQMGRLGNRRRSWPQGPAWGIIAGPRWVPVHGEQQAS